MEEIKTYTFDAEFQQKICALALKDSQFMRRTEGLIKPEYFENVTDGYVISVLNNFYKKYKDIPRDKATILECIRQGVKKKIIRKEVAGDVVKRLDELRDTEITNRDFVIDSVSTFARHQAVTTAIYEAVEKHLDFNDFENIEAKITKALKVGALGDSTGYDFGAEIENRTNVRIERAEGKAPPTGITTGYPDLDKHLLPHKGWGRRELSVLMGPAKVGKSTALMDFGLSACGNINHYNVLYVTLEVSADIISERADAHISNTATRDLGLTPQKVKDAVLAWRANAGRFIIEDHPTGSMRVSDLRRILEKYRSEGLMFDLVIIDYADLMIPERVTDNAIENSKNIWVALRGLASSENIAVLTATQTNREGAKKMVATMTDVADDFNKVRIADTLISINKTEDEARMNQCRLYLAAIRNAPSGFSIRLEQDIPRMQFVKNVLGEE